MSERDLWQYKTPDLYWKRLGAGNGYAEQLVDTYLVAVKSDAKFDGIAYYDQPREVLCSQIDGFDKYAGWPVSGHRPAVHWTPWRPVWAMIVVSIFQQLGVIVIVEIKLCGDESTAFDEALAATG